MEEDVDFWGEEKECAVMDGEDYSLCKRPTLVTLFTFSFSLFLSFSLVIMGFSISISIKSHDTFQIPFPPTSPSLPLPMLFSCFFPFFDTILNPPKPKIKASKPKTTARVTMAPMTPLTAGLSPFPFPFPFPLESESEEEEAAEAAEAESSSEE